MDKNIEGDIEDIKKIFEKYDKHTEHFSLNGINIYGRVVDIIDGDSLNIVIPVFDNYYKFNVRLNGIDTSEIKSKNEENRNMGKMARIRLGQLLINQLINDFIEIKEYISNNIVIVWLECLKFDKYGRLLANIYLVDNKEKSLSKILIEEKLAYEYNGGTKLTEEEQHNFFKYF